MTDKKSVKSIPKRTKSDEDAYADLAEYLIGETNPMTELEYLREHHHITETAIGLVKLHLLQNEAEKASNILEKYSEKLTKLRYEYQPELKELKDG